jgi:hypothetical protein
MREDNLADRLGSICLICGREIQKYSSVKIS